MAFENEFFEMAQALEENADMLHVENPLLDSQVGDRIGQRLCLVKIDRRLETSPGAFEQPYCTVQESRATDRIEIRSVQSLAG